MSSAKNKSIQKDFYKDKEGYYINWSDINA